MARRIKKPVRSKPARKRSSVGAGADDDRPEPKRSFPADFNFASLELNRGAPTRQYLLNTLFPALNDGLREVNRQRPDDPVEWLGQYFLARSSEPKQPIVSLSGCPETSVESSTEYSVEPSLEPSEEPSEEPSTIPSQESLLIKADSNTVHPVPEVTSVPVNTDVPAVETSTKASVDPSNELPEPVSNMGIELQNEPQQPLAESETMESNKESNISVDQQD